MTLLLLAACGNDASITSTDKAPAVAILSPVNGAIFEPEQPLSLCTQVDDESPLEDLTLSFRSSVDDLVWQGETLDACEGGNLGFTVNLSDADHELTLSAIDGRGNTGQASVGIVASENTAPWCELLEPAEDPDGDGVKDAALVLGETLHLRARVGDAESSASSLVVLIASDLDGEIWADVPASSGEVELDWTPETGGNHLVTLEVSDPRLELERCTLKLFADPCPDGDGDGVDSCSGDCDDADPSSYPGAKEVPDLADNDCDLDVDEGTALGDDDADGFTEVDGDCDDADGSSWPGAAEIAYDGVDQDCDGGDLVDVDGDGFDWPSEDCDDGDAAINPVAAETWYDGVDADCAGDDDYDADADGHRSKSWGGDDCDDGNAAVSPSASETWYDGVDGDCDGGDDYDADGDGYRSDTWGGLDCDDGSAAVNPAATEIFYDGKDSDCDGGNDFDADGDGFSSDAYGGADCDDANAKVNPSATETWYDGVDADCDGADDNDADSDGFAWDGAGGDDCDDSDAKVNPAATESWYDGVDADCDGASDYDADADGDDSDAFGGGDCDDSDPATSSTAGETRDGADNDCDDKCDEGLLSAGDLVITEIMKDPSKVSDTYGEWFELYNSTAVDIQLCDGWTFKDKDGESFAMSAGSTVLVAAGGYAVYARGDASTNGGVTPDYVYASGMQLGNADDEIILVFDGTEIDRVEYDDGKTFPDTAGYSLTLNPKKLDSTSNNTGSNWCNGASTFGSGDRGTPGAANDGC